MWIYLLIIALIPGIAIMVFIYRKDKHEKEPLKKIFISFLLGILAAIISVPIEWLLMEYGQNWLGADTVKYKLFEGFIGAAAIEEILKFSMVRLYAYPKQSFNEPIDGIVYAVMLAMGFATIENIGYVMMDPQNGITTGILRMLLSVPGHGCWAVIVGYFVGKAKFSQKNRGIYMLIGLLIAIVMHGTYDSLLFLKESNDLPYVGGAVFTAILGYILAFKAIKLHQQLTKQYLPEI